MGGGKVSSEKTKKQERCEVWESVEESERDLKLGVIYMPLLKECVSV